MNTSRLTAGASRFAHFAGLTRNRRSRRAAEGDDDQRDDARAEDDEDDDGDDDDDRDEPKGKRGRKSRAEEDDRDEGDEDEPKGKRSRRAAEGDDDDDSDDDRDEPKGKRGRKSRAEEDDDSDAEDDDDKEEMTGKSAAASARRRERARCAAIFGCSAAAGNVALAASLAFETNMSRKEAIGVLKGQAGRTDRDDAPPRNRHARVDRTSRNRDLHSDAEPSGKQGVKSSWDATWSKLGVKAR